MSRQPKRNVDKIFELLEEWNFCYAKDQILRLFDPIWKKAKNILNKDLIVRNIYIYLSQNINGILERFHKKFNISFDH